jgi:hypothetical protein
LNDPEGEGTRRSRKHTEKLVEVLQLGVLWDEYGLVGDIVVNVFVSRYFFSSFIFIFHSSSAFSHSYNCYTKLRFLPCPVEL